MSVIRVNKTDNYTVMSNYHFKEKEMSLKAKGLLSMMLSLPDDWNYSIAGLETICKENETAIKSALKELTEFGYVKVEKILPNKTESGRFEYIYNIYEKPQKQGVEKQGVENLHLEILGVENQGQLNTKELNTKKLKTNNKKYRILEEIEKRCFDKDEKFLDLILEFYKNLIDNNKLITIQRIEADLIRLSAVNNDIAILTITTALEKGWQSLNPEWVQNNNSNKRGTYDISNSEPITQDDKDLINKLKNGRRF